MKDIKRNKLFVGFTPAVSKTALNSMRAEIRKLALQRRTELELSDIAEMVNPAIRGWKQYYGRYSPSALQPVFRHINGKLITWTMRKHKRFRSKKMQAVNFLKKCAEGQPKLFAHWEKGKALV